MSDARLHLLKHLDACLANREEVASVQEVLKRIQRCCQAVDQGLNLADILRDPANRRSLDEAFGPEAVDVGMQLLLRVALGHHSMRSFSTTQAIEGTRKLEFLHRSMGGWNQFDALISLQHVDEQGISSLRLVNPQNRQDWLELAEIPAGTLVSLYLRTQNGKRSASQERTALERMRAVFEMMQSRADLEEVAPAPAVALKPKTARSRPQPAPRAPVSRELSFQFEVTINKLDTFIHAGNAHLISSHVSDYPGQIKMFVMRGSKVPVLIDADTIWGLEIRNGETVLYEFYGPKPSETFVKELAQRTNKYTQMDKVANE